MLPRADQVLASLAHDQDGVISERRAKDAGITRKQIEYRIEQGSLVRWRAGVLVHPAVPWSPRQELRCAVLASTAAASHRSAGWLHGLIDWPPPRPEVSLPNSCQFRDERVQVYRQNDWDLHQLIELRGIPTTDAVRTVIDLGTKVSLSRLGAIVELGLTNELYDFDELVQRHFALARRGRDGVGPLREILTEWAPDLAAVESHLEAHLWQIIVRRQLPRPLRQHEVTCSGQLFRLDLAYPEHKVAIEGDGFGVHSKRQAHERDRERQNLLTLSGWVVLRFTWQQIIRRPDYVEHTIRQVLRDRSNLTKFGH